MALLISNVSVQACYHEIFPTNNYFYSNHKSSPTIIQYSEMNSRTSHLLPMYNYIIKLGNYMPTRQAKFHHILQQNHLTLAHCC